MVFTAVFAAWSPHGLCLYGLRAYPTFCRFLLGRSVNPQGWKLVLDCTVCSSMGPLRSPCFADCRAGESTFVYSPVACTAMAMLYGLQGKERVAQRRS